MSNDNIPPNSRVPDPRTDVPPRPGELGVDPYNLPPPVRDELLKPDPVALDTQAAELKDGTNPCPKCGATDCPPEARH
jgi:hypothetical protein